MNELENIKVTPRPAIFKRKTQLSSTPGISREESKTFINLFEIKYQFTKHN